jgi:thiamine biosynthesis protein ThiS
VQITIGGKQTEVPDGLSISQLVKREKAPNSIIVVLNDDIIEPSLWESTTLNANDKVELIQFVAGG